MAYPLFRKMKEKMGFENVKVFFQGAAPSNVELKRFFLGFDINIIEVYGTSETCGIAVLGPSMKNMKAVGKSILGDGSEVGIHKPNDDGEGEIRIKSRTIFMGYLDDLQSTLDCICKDRWYYTGDIGRLSKDGILEVTGRQKEIIITSGGENVPPYNIEALIKSELTGLSHVLVVGNNRKYLTCLVTIKVIQFMVINK